MPRDNYKKYEENENPLSGKDIVDLLMPFLDAGHYAN